MLVLEQNAKAILTDSGGVQNEAYFFEVPCITLREETEWVETVQSGWNQVVGTDPDRICQAVVGLRPGKVEQCRFAQGSAATRIVTVLNNL